MKVFVVIPMVIDNSNVNPWDTNETVMVDTAGVKLFPFTNEGKKAKNAYVAEISPNCAYVEVEIKELEL